MSFDLVSALEALNSVEYAVQRMKDDEDKAAESPADHWGDGLWHRARAGAYGSVLTLLDVLREEYNNG